uniref:Uncharacterized protein n=1 Tax=Glossina brevipalpis TaxID=37001 RepID=A0A1A9WGP9_9MUSC
MTTVLSLSPVTVVSIDSTVAVLRWSYENSIMLTMQAHYIYHCFYYRCCDCISSLAIMKAPFAVVEDFSLIKYCSRDLVAVIFVIDTALVLISLLRVVAAVECTFTNRWTSKN